MRMVDALHRSLQRACQACSLCQAGVLKGHCDLPDLLRLACSNIDEVSFMGGASSQHWAQPDCCCSVHGIS